jgi:hypothetical protein
MAMSRKSWKSSFSGYSRPRYFHCAARAFKNASPVGAVNHFLGREESAPYCKDVGAREEGARIVRVNSGRRAEADIGQNGPDMPDPAETAGQLGRKELLFVKAGVASCESFAGRRHSRHEREVTGDCRLGELPSEGGADAEASAGLYGLRLLLWLGDCPCANYGLAADLHHARYHLERALGPQRHLDHVDTGLDQSRKQRLGMLGLGDREDRDKRWCFSDQH